MNKLGFVGKHLFLLGGGERGVDRRISDNATWGIQLKTCKLRNVKRTR
jgi:hypothetical protein